MAEKVEAGTEKAELAEAVEEKAEAQIFALKVTANREDQVMDFVAANAARKKIPVYAILLPRGMRGYIFVEAKSRVDAEAAAHDIPYARRVLPTPIPFSEIEHMLEIVKREIEIRKNDIIEIMAGPFKAEQAKVTRIDKVKEEVVVELLGVAVPIPITLKIDAVKVIRREAETKETS